MIVNAGLRYRRQLREQDEKINILVNAQIENAELFAKNEERFRANEERFKANEERFKANEQRFKANEERFRASVERFTRNEERFAKYKQRTDRLFAELAQVHKDLAKAQVQTDRQLKSLTWIVSQNRN